MATPRRTIPLYGIWATWALMGFGALGSNQRAMFDLFITVTTLETMNGMLEVGIRPASHPTSATKD